MTKKPFVVKYTRQNSKAASSIQKRTRRWLSNRTVNRFCPITLNSVDPEDAFYLLEGKSRYLYDAGALLQFCKKASYISPVTRRPLNVVEKRRLHNTCGEVTAWQENERFSRARQEDEATFGALERELDEVLSDPTRVWGMDAFQVTNDMLALDRVRTTEVFISLLRSPSNRALPVVVALSRYVCSDIA
jgi:hypothetical protein